MKSTITSSGDVITIAAFDGHYAVDYQRYHGEDPVYSVSSAYRGTAATLRTLIQWRSLRRFEQRFVREAL